MKFNETITIFTIKSYNFTTGLQYYLQKYYISVTGCIKIHSVCSIKILIRNGKFLTKP